MSSPVSPVAPGYHSVTPYLVVDGAQRVIDFARDAFGAQELRRMAGPDGRIGHAELRIGDSVVMLADACPEFPATRAGLHLYLADVDAVYERALRVGGVSLQPPSDKFYGDRSATVADPAGNWWSISTHIEDMSDEEMQRRAAEAFQQK